MSETCLFNPFGLMFGLVLGYWNNEIQRFYTMNIIICGSAKLYIYLTKKKMIASRLLGQNQGMGQWVIVVLIFDVG